MRDRVRTKLARVVLRWRGQARLTEENMQAMLRDVPVALLEADVALPVVRDFIAGIKEKALGEEVTAS
jgi:signal recognition particle subunit SRP54